MRIDRRAFMKTGLSGAAALTAPSLFSRTALGRRHHRRRRPVLADRRPFDHREVAAGRDTDGDLRDQRVRRRHGQAGQRHRRGRRLRSQDLQRKGLEAGHRRQARRPCSAPTHRRAARPCCRCSKSTTPCISIPTYYEGFECSRNVVYTGAVPNQQLSNFIPWIVKTLGKKKFFIVGSNYIYPREMAKVCKILMKQNGGKYVADEYLELGHSEWGSMVNKIKNSGCDAVLSNVVGDSVVAFYREFKNQGLTHDKLPICATVTSEIEIAAMGAEYAVGSYTSFPYFMAIDTGEQGLRRALPQIRQGPEGGDAPRAGCVLFPGLPVEAGGGEGEARRPPTRCARACAARSSTRPTATSRSIPKPAHLADAAHRPVAGGRPGQDRRRLQASDRPAALCSLWRDRDQPVLHAKGRR